MQEKYIKPIIGCEVYICEDVSVLKRENTMYHLILLCKNEIRDLVDYFSEIHLIIQGSDNQQLLNSGFEIEPSEVLVNGVKDDSCKKTCNLVGNKNNITLRFENQIESCYEMFSGLNNIIEIDLTNFDASKTTNMENMFRHCSNLEKIEFGNINTSSVENMRSLFSGCSKLTSLDLSNFDFS